MQIIYDDEDLYLATLPFYNGCSFRLIVKEDGSCWLDLGCYLLVNLITGVPRHLYQQYTENGNKPIRVYPTKEGLARILETKPCRHCGGAILEQSEKETKCQTNSN